MKKQLRFAPIIRVSTEKQAAKGESLSTQKKQIEEAVKYHGGIIPKNCWKYCGQEHATPDQERKKFDKLIRDSSKNLFDAVIVCDASRWSRDNVKSKQSLEILSQNNIRFFILHHEYNLFNPQQVLYLGLASVINEFQAQDQTQKSLLNRIERAKRGKAVSGKLPYGRIKDPATGDLILDEGKQKKIELAANLYLEGKKMPEIAKMFGMNASNLHKILTKRCGDKWDQRFRSKKLNIEETVTITIPRLLPQETIDQIVKRAAANRTYLRGEKKNRYLLSGMIFCDHCGYTIFGQTNRFGKRYYRHPRKRKFPCQHEGGYLPAEMIEHAVMVHLFSTFQNKQRLEKAIQDAIPDPTEHERLLQDRKEFEKELKKLKESKRRLLIKVEDGIFDDDYIKERVQEHQERERLLTTEIDNINRRIEITLSPKQLIIIRDNIQNILFKGIRKNLEKAFSRSSELSHKRLYKMTYKEKKDFLIQFFGGTDTEGKKLGVYIRKEDDGEWLFTIKGVFGNIQSHLPLEEERERYILGIDDDTESIEKDTEEENDEDHDDVQNMLGECHAYHSLGFYQR